MKKLVLLMALVLVEGLLAQERTVAVFMQNHSSNRGLDSQLVAFRERLSATFAEMDGFTLIDAPQASGGSEISPGLLKTLGCDYAVVGGIVSATSLAREIGEKNEATTVYTLRMSLKVLTAEGRSVDGLSSWMRKMPILGRQGDPEVYYDLLFDQWIKDVVVAVKAKSPRWPVPPRTERGTAPTAVVEAPSVQPSPEKSLLPVRIKISTTIDRVVEEFESQTKGVNGERLAELRKVVRGAQIKLDDVVIGSAPLSCMVTPGLHRLRVERAWMKPYSETIRVTDGFTLEVPLELSDEGIRKWGTIERVQADCAQKYAEAAMTRGIKVNVDTSRWHDVGDGRVTLPRSK